jgi:hypothetical protein
MNISREWATPLTIGAFLVMSVTGILMFFHLNVGLNKPVHEWAGWAMVGGVVLHAAANARAFIRHLTVGSKGRIIIAAFAVVLAGSFFSLPGSSAQVKPPVLAFNAISRAPLTSVAALAGKPVETVIAELEAAGIRIANASDSLDTALGGDRGETGRAIGVIFPASAKTE